MLVFFKRYKAVLLVTGALILLLGIAYFFVARWAVNSLFESDTATPNATEYAGWTGIWLPDDVRNFQAYAEGWQDWLVEARFELSSRNLPEFLERNNLQRVEPDYQPESHFDLEWFQSENELEVYEIVPSSESASSTATGFYPTFWIDTSNPDKITVYIKAFNT